MAARNTRQKIVATLALCVLLAGCKAPSINLTTNEAIKVDIAMRLDVYQHGGGTGATSAAAKPDPTPVRSGDPEQRRKDRQADIQTFKNSRLVGENHNGLLVVLEETAGDNGEYVRRTVAGENNDRMALMKAQAEKEKRSLTDIQKEAGALWANRSFKGEWIEVAGSDGKYKWAQKEG